MATLGKTTITDLSVYNTIHGKIEEATYSASAGYSASAARATYSASAGYSASAARATYSASAGYSASAAQATYAASAGSANKVVNKLTITVGKNAAVEYDGSSAKSLNITADSLGLTNVFDYKGITTTTVTDGSTTKPIVIGGSNYTQKTGDVVIVNNDTDKEYFWNGTKWEELGRTIDLSGYSLTSHTHTQYAPTSHTHNYSPSNHTHSNYVTNTALEEVEEVIAQSHSELAEAIVELQNSSSKLVTDEARYIYYFVGSSTSSKNEDETLFKTASVYANNGGVLYANTISATGNTSYSFFNSSKTCTAIINNRLTLTGASRVTFNGGNNYIYGSATYCLNINSKTSTIFAINGANEMYLTPTELRPATNSGLSLGNATYRFNNGYFYNTFSTNGFYESSDETKKTFYEDISIDLNKISELPKKYFTWKDDKENKRQIGTSAQELRKLYPELVYGEEGNLTVDYAKLSVIALKGIDVLNDKVKQLEDRLSKIEELLNK